MEFSSSTMFNKKIIDYYNDAALNEFLPSVIDSFEFVSSGPDKLEVKDGYQNELTIKFIFKTLNDDLLTNLQISFNFTLTITNLGSAFREPGRRYLKGICSILSVKMGDNGYSVVTDWLYKKTNQSTLIQINGIEDKSEGIQLKKILDEAKEFINTYKESVHEHHIALLVDHPELYEGFESVKDIFLF